MKSPCILIYRVGNFFYRRNMKGLALLITYINRILLGGWIPSSCNIGKDVKIGYSGIGVVLHSHARIGNNCIICQNVTIGGKGGVKGVPIIEDNVFVGAGACILGDIVVGHDSVIGANSVVNKKVDPFTVVAGVPAKYIRSLSVDEIKKKPLLN